MQTKIKATLLITYRNGRKVRHKRILNFGVCIHVSYSIHNARDLKAFTIIIIIIIFIIIMFLANPILYKKAASFQTIFGCKSLAIVCFALSEVLSRI